MSRSKVNSVDIAFGVFAVVLYCMIVNSYLLGEAGWVALLIMFASPIGFAWWCFFEAGLKRVRYVFNPRRQFWSFLGDIACITPIAYLAAAHFHESWLSRQWWVWGIIAPVLSVAGSLAFHYGMNRDGYPDNHTAVDSPSYRYHAITTYPVLLATVFAFAFTHISNVWSFGYARWMLALGVLWGLFAAFDTMRENPKWLDHPRFGRFFRYFAIDRNKVHVAWNKEQMRPQPRTRFSI